MTEFAQNQLVKCYSVKMEKNRRACLEIFMAVPTSRPKLRTAYVLVYSLTLNYTDANSSIRFRNARKISPLYTSGPVAVTSDGQKIVTCVGEEILLTDVTSGAEICRFLGVSLYQLAFFFASYLPGHPSH